MESINYFHKSSVLHAMKRKENEKQKKNGAECLNEHQSFRQAKRNHTKEKFCCSIGIEQLLLN